MQETEKGQQAEGRALKKKGDRRAFLAAAAGAAAGATAATLLPQTAGRAHAQPGFPLIIGQDNDGEDQGTRLHATNGAFEAHGGSGIGVLGITNALAPEGPGGFLPAGVLGSSLLPGPGKPWGDMTGVAGVSGTGTGVHGESESGSGVVGRSVSGPGVEAWSESGPGVTASSESGPGVLAASQSGHGVHAYSLGPAPAVEGESQDGPGVRGHSRSGPGMIGQSPGPGGGVVGVSPASGPGVRAYSGWYPSKGEPLVPDGGLALDVIGKARFSSAGAGLVPARVNAVTVYNRAVTPASHITVTFTRDPGGVAVAWVERQMPSGQQPVGRFVVHLSGRPPRAVPFTYLIVEPGA